MTHPSARTGNPHLVRGVIAGVAGGLVASWVMNLYLAGVSKAQEVLQDPAEKAQQRAPSGDDSTQKVADALIYQVKGRHLSKDEKKTAGPLVHYIFGGLMGGVYGAVAECSPASRVGAGTLFGSVLFLGSDEIMIPALGLGKPPTQEPIGSQANHWAAHLVYGATVELVRRGVRHLI